MDINKITLHTHNEQTYTKSQRPPLIIYVYLIVGHNGTAFLTRNPTARTTYTHTHKTNTHMPALTSYDERLRADCGDYGVVGKVLLLLCYFSPSCVCIPRHLLFVYISTHTQTHTQKHTHAHQLNLLNVIRHICWRHNVNMRTAITFQCLVRGAGRKTRVLSDIVLFAGKQRV